VELRVEFNLGINDILAYYLYSRVDSSKEKRRQKIQLIIFLLLIVLVGTIGILSWPNKVLFVPSVIFCILVLSDAIFNTKTKKNQTLLKEVK
jgi:peptidoglycan/LPS O-acetylase OafA/YrhL